MSVCGIESCMPGSLSVLLAESNSSDKRCNHSPQSGCKLALFTSLDLHGYSTAATSTMLLSLSGHS